MTPAAVGLGLAAVYAALAAPTVSAGDMPAMVQLSSLALALALVVLSVIDIETFRLPDIITLPLAGVGIGVAGWLGADDPWWRAAAAMAGFGCAYLVAVIYKALRGREGLGLGDAKLLAAAGAWTGFEGLMPTLLVACVTALVAALGMALLRGGVSRQTAIPFGPFLALGLWTVWLYGPVGF